MPEYPAVWESDVVLADGGTVHLRPIRADDDEGLLGLYTRLSDESIYLRFFSPVPRPTASQIEHLTGVDYDRRFALVAELGDDMVGVIEIRHEPNEGGVVQLDGRLLSQWLPWHFDHCYNDQLNRAGVLRAVEIVPEDGRVLATSGAVIAGLTYNFLPFMILPLYASLERIDPRMLEAGYDLYGTRRAVFTRSRSRSCRGSSGSPPSTIRAGTGSRSSPRATTPAPRSSCTSAPAPRGSRRHLTLRPRSPARSCSSHR